MTQVKKLEIKINGNAHVLLITLKGTKITLPVVILYYSTLSSTNRQILTNKIYVKHNIWLFFKNNSREAVSSCVCSVMGIVKKINFTANVVGDTKQARFNC